MELSVEWLIPTAPPDSDPRFRPVSSLDESSEGQDFLKQLLRSAAAEALQLRNTTGFSLERREQVVRRSAELKSIQPMAVERLESVNWHFDDAP
jgi:hypothetical protein